MWCNTTSTASTCKNADSTARFVLHPRRGGIREPPEEGERVTHLVTIADAEARLEELIDRALAGEEVILVADGTAVAKLEPVEQASPE